MIQHDVLECNLRQMIDDKSFMAQHGTKILKMLVQRIYSFNKLGLALRDLKPDNIYLD